MTPKPTPPEDSLRPHVYDGIQEYEKRLPNWWLYTLYVTIVFWVGYWAYYEWFHVGKTGAQAVEIAMQKIKTDQLLVAKLDDGTLWKMSQDPGFVQAGKATFLANCSACHLASMRGKAENPAAIGPDLTDTAWIHGGKPSEILDTITKGVLVKGMPPWGPVLGSKKITEVAAYILSVHHEGEPIVVEVPKVPTP